MRLKTTIKAAKKAIKLAEKNPMLYTDEEILYMKRALRQARQALAEKRERLNKGFKPNATIWSGQTSVGDTPSGTDDGVRGEGEQPTEPGES